MVCSHFLGCPATNRIGQFVSRDYEETLTGDDWRLSLPTVLDASKAEVTWVAKVHGTIIDCNSYTFNIP